MIAPFAIESLKEHRVRQLEAKLKAGASWQEHDYVFCTLHGTHLGPNHVVEEFKLLLHRCYKRGKAKRNKTPQAASRLAWDVHKHVVVAHTGYA